MSDWEYKLLGALCDLKNGYAFKSKDYRVDGILNFRVVNINWDGTINLSNDRKYLPKQFKDTHSQYLLEVGDILFVMVGATRGKLGQIPESILPALMNQNMWRVVPTDDRLHKDFLFFFLRHKVPALLGESDDQARGFFKKSDFRDISLPLPPLPEQKKIAHILSTVQRAIEAQERIIQTTTELKKALMHKLFTEGLRNEPQKQTEIGPVPKSWEVMELSEFFQIKHGFAFDGKFFKPAGEYILMTPGHFHEEGGFRDQGEKTKYFTGEIPQDYVLAKDDLVVAMTEQKSGLLGSSAFVPEDGRYLHNQRLGLIVDLDTKRLSKSFLFNVFNLPHFRVEVAKTSTGSKVKHTSPTKLRAVKVGIPPTLEEQEEVATALATTEQKIRGATKKKTQLQDLFRALLHKLMTAKIRVHNLEITA